MATAEISERLGRIEEKLERIQKCVEGNGQPGLWQRVGKLENWRSWITGAVSVLGAAVAWLLKG